MATWNPTTGATAYPAISVTPAQATATTRQVDPSELMSNQIADITKTNAPLMQMAQTAGKQAANKTGLLNSSMAVGAAQNEVLKAAAPIAQHQANTVTGVLNANQNNTQATNVANMQATNNALDNQFKQQAQLQTADIEAQYKTLMQANDAAMKTYQSAVQNINDILMNPDLTAAAKTQAVNNQNQLLKTGMQIIGKMDGINLDSLLTFPTV